MQDLLSHMTLDFCPDLLPCSLSILVRHTPTGSIQSGIASVSSVKGPRTNRHRHTQAYGDIFVIQPFFHTQAYTMVCGCSGVKWSRGSFEVSF